MANVGSYPYTSLCKVIKKNFGQLKRLADVVGDEINDVSNSPYIIYNWLYTKDCNMPKDFIGIWNWSTQRNQNGKYSIVSKLDRSKVPIEIIVLKDCNSEEKLTIRLFKGIDFTLSSGKALISYAVDENTYIGILCTDQNFTSDGKMKLSTLQFFKFSIKNCVLIDEKIFYSKLTLGTPEHTIDAEDLNQLMKKQPVTQKISEANTQIERLKYEINILIKRRAELEQEIEVLQNSREELIAQQSAQTVDRDVDDDFVYAFEDTLGVENGTIEKFALYMRAAFDNKTPLLLAGPKGREIADAFSTALTGKTAAVFDCAAVKSLDDLKVIEVVDDLIVAIINPLAPNFIAYIPEIVGIKNKFIVALHPFAEDLKLEPRGLYNYFLPVFTELIIDSAALIRKTVKTLKSNVDGSTELFAEFPFEYVNGRGEKFLRGFKGDGATLDKMRAFMGGDDE